MGLDTNIIVDGKSIYYYRKNWELQDWWNSLAEKKYPHLLRELYTEEDRIKYKWEDWELIEYNNEILDDPTPDFNCVDIPITPEDWEEFMSSVNREVYSECNERVLDAFKKGKKVFINGWW
jgi:hypothetical protein